MLVKHCSLRVCVCVCCPIQGDERFIWNAHVLRDLTAQSEVSEEANELWQLYRCLLARLYL